MSSKRAKVCVESEEDSDDSYEGSEGEDSSEESVAESEDPFIEPELGKVNNNISIDYSDFIRDITAELTSALGEDKKDIIRERLDKVVEHTKMLYLPLAGPKPKGKIIGAAEKDAERLQKELDSIRLEIELSGPTPLRIISSHMSHQQKKRAIEDYDMFTNMEQYSPSWLDLRRDLDTRINEANKEKITGDQRDECDKIKATISDEISQESLEYRILKANISDDNKRVIYNAWQDLQTRSPLSDDYPKIRNMITVSLDACTLNRRELPVTKDSSFEERRKFILHVKSVLDEELESLDDVKQELLEEVSTMISNPFAKHKGIALCGNPGTGKTAISMALGKALNFPYYKISVSSVNDRESITGSNSVFTGSRQGRIVNALQHLKCRNGIIFLDEFNRATSKSTDGDRNVSDAFLEVIDPTQNSEFQDAFMPEVKFDLSEILFMYSMNAPPEDPALRDRLHIIEVKPYTFSEKCRIVKNKIFPRVVDNVKFDPDLVVLSDETVRYLVETFSINESGVRQLQNKIKSLVKRLNHIYLVGSTHKKLKNMEFPLTLTPGICEVLLADRSNKPYMTMFS